MRFALPLTTLAASLALAAPAFAQAPGTVGPPTVITDPSSEVGTVPGHLDNQPPPPQQQTAGSQPEANLSPPSDSTPPPLHVTAQVIGHRPALSSATQTSSQPARQSFTPAPASVPASTTSVAQHTSAQQLPFTGLPAWQLAMLGVMLLGSGLALRRVLVPGS